MKKILLAFTILILHTLTTKAQFYKSVVPSPLFSKALQEVVCDFRFNYENIKGDTIANDGVAQIYASTVVLPGVKEATITYYNSKKDTTASWDGVAYRGENFSEAVKAYRNTYRLVKKSWMKWIDKSLMRFSGEMEEPKESVGFASSTLYIDLPDDRYKKYVAQIDLQSNGYDSWEVHISLHNKKADNEQF